MLIHSDRFGSLQVDDGKVIRFPAGIPGFPEERNFVLLKLGLEETPFWWLQSVDSSGCSFLLVEPNQILTGYDIQLPDHVLEELQLQPEEPAEALLIVTVPQGNMSLATANLKAPVVINPLQHLAAQMILEHAQYPIRQPLFPKAEV